MAYEAKTKATKLSVASYLDAIKDPARRKDCKTLATLMTRVTGCKPVLWGASIVGFDQYHYKYASGHEGDSCVVGFSNRKGDISVYLLGGYESATAQRLLKRLGKHKTGKACLYLPGLAGVDLAALEELISRSVADTRKRYAPAKGASR
ncbi:MAG: DUF1801 domain-containing protein [Gemmatimonadetes bacterium]|nr:DUF1801 domain-containing protein [Gemmatimonadota bacterium]MBK7715632.1 DUF1801 domain-containing protein [Gemmatimonadota bacterium]MBK7925598.1 DUF1801 domain-containing protein [Gemmatimonadota bacterium]MBK9066323.1 DUF1801 domain-containing protein [Gemmatimonadota bacterium]MBP6669130.1 DUF1801 domain-containing protein [Gemmatimonadales bacterium]